jgi:PadR family transcriptional regulator PadR
VVKKTHASTYYTVNFTNLLLLSKRKHAIIPVGNLKVDLRGLLDMKDRADVLQGTLALMVLKTLDVMGPQHGWGIARRIEQISGDLLAVNQGTLYPLLLKLEHEGSIASEWGASENNRRARFYRLTAAGRRQLLAETRDWEQTSAIIARFFEVKAEDLS